MQARLVRRTAAALAVAVCVFTGGARAQGDVNGAYCEPQPGTKLLYSDRAYLILPKPKGAMAIEYSYQILHNGRHVERYGQFLFDDGNDRWAFESNPQGLDRFWPLSVRKRVELERYDRYTRAHAFVSFVVQGMEPTTVGPRSYVSWKVHREDRLEDGSTTEQTLWYSSQLCTLTAFTDSQDRMVELLRILNPGDRDYNRPLARRLHKLYFSDTNELVK
jgi:hypothetical protein